MKKKNIIIPAVLVALTLLIIPFVTVFTTAYSYDFALAKYSFGADSDHTVIFKNSFRPIEIASKLSPNASTLGTRNFLFGNRYGDVELSDLEKLCPDYKQKAIEYTKEYVDFVKSDGYINNDRERAYVAMSGDAKESEVSYAVFIYATNLYDYGNKEQAKKVCEDYIKSLPPEKLAEFTNILFFANNIYADSQENADWAENLCDYIVNTHNSNLEAIKKAFAETGGYVERYNSAEWMKFKPETANEDMLYVFIRPTDMDEGVEY